MVGLLALLEDGLLDVLLVDALELGRLVILVGLALGLDLLRGLARVVRVGLTIFLRLLLQLLLLVEGPRSGLVVRRVELRVVDDLLLLRIDVVIDHS